MSRYRYQVSVLVICLSMILSVSVVRALLVPVPSVVYPDLVPTAAQPYVLEVPFGKPDYYLGEYVNGSCFAVNGSSWDRFVVAASASDVLQDCIDALPYGGFIAVSSGTFDLTDRVNITGCGYDGLTLAYGELVIQGVGRRTVFNVLSGKIGFYINNASCVRLQDFKVNVASGGYHAIYGANDGNVRQESMFFGTLKGITVYSECAAGYSGIYLQNPSFSTFEDLNLYVQGGSSVMTLSQADSDESNWGDLLFRGHNYLKVNTDNGACLRVTVEAGVTKQLNMIRSEGYLSLYSWASNVTALDMRSAMDGRFDGLDIQGDGIVWGIVLGAVTDSQFDGGGLYQYVHNGTMFYVADGCYRNTFSWFNVRASGDFSTIVHDNYNDANNPNVFQDCHMVGAGTYLNDVSASSVVQRMRIGAGATYLGVWEQNVE